MLASGLRAGALRAATDLWDRVDRRAEASAASAEWPPGPSFPAPVQLVGWMRFTVPFLEECRRRYGPTFTVRFPRIGRMLVTGEPALVKEIFTGSPEVLHAGKANVALGPLLGQSSVLLLDGARHMRHRRLLLPPFHGARMHRYGETMREITEAQMGRWPIGQPFAVHPHLQEITLDVILRTVFGLEEGARMQALRALILEILNRFESPLFLIPALHRDLGPWSPWARFVDLRARMDRLIYEQIAHRRERVAREGGEQEDILALLLAARDEEGAPLTEEELRDELLTLLAAGHETTATGLAWALHWLTREPALGARVVAEVERDAGGDAADPEAVRERVYLDAFLKETLRLRPVVPNVGRYLMSPFRVGPWEVPAGSAVLPSIYLAHRDPEAWPDPLRFDPGRFLDEEGQARRVSPYAYFPFGGSVRRCIGMAFAMYEMKVVLSTLLRAVRLRAAPGYQGRIERRGVTLVPEAGMPLIAERRRSSRAGGASPACYPPAT